jgi:1,4-dihydroxy-2-naphthoate octaprenyltransferase
MPELTKRYYLVSIHNRFCSNNWRNEMKRYLELSRAPFFTAIIMPVLFATALAWNVRGTVDWTVFALTLVSLVAAHAGANLFNDYFDWRLGADQLNRNRNRFSGGSPHIVEGKARPGLFLGLGIASFALCLGTGVAMFFLCGQALIPLALMGLAGLAIGVFYTAPPFKLAYRGMGEACIFAAFGILPVMGVYYTQTGEVTAWALVACLPLGFLVTNIILINEFPDYASDREAGKRHLVVRLGTGPARYLYLAIALAAFGAVGWLCIGSPYGGWTALGLLGLPAALAAAVVLFRNADEPPALLPAQGLTIVAHIVTGILLTVGLLIK